MAGRLGILAGSGNLPAQVAESCRRDGRDLFIIALEGQAVASELPEGVPTAWYRMGAAGAILDRLKAEGVRDIVMAGRVRRPSLAELRPDWRAAQVLARASARALGDDGLLGAVSKVLEQEGFHVVGADELAGDLLTPVGVLTRALPDEQAEADIARGIAAARDLGRLDIGQAVVVQQGIVLGVEAIEGTDALISRCAGLKRSGAGPVLVKVRKPQQDRRFDLPAIGPDTVTACAAAGFAGIAAEAGGTLFLGRESALTAADAAGLFVAGVNCPIPEAE
ncbi:LpxI family protein [Indioceanicola profundi]|uniref:LpxI family protein n=1 Tax=Indioceanicola profundi TaxID=2220096 RepID=UPI000E6ACA55|nr:UDP-2,3-diacylglucosamine diphosphatase LpxI [Indioceanicola profundi]